MAIQVKHLTTKNISSKSDATNEYLYLTNSLDNMDSKLRVSDLYVSAESTGNGASLFTQMSQLNKLKFKSIKAIDTTISITSGDEIGIAVAPANIDLSKCNNLTSLFLSTVNLASNVGATVLPTANGGTNRSSAWVIGDLVYASATNTLASIAAVATGNALISGGTGTVPSWGKIPLTTHISGTLPVANGGTGATSLTDDGVLFGNATGAVGATAKGSNGQVLIGGATTPAFASITSTSGTVRFTAGSNTLDLDTRISSLETPGGTAVLNIDGAGDIVPQGSYKTYYKRPVINHTAATLAPSVAQSGAIFTLNRAAGVTITLPAAATGLTYEFHVGTTFSGTFQIDAASSADTLQGAIYMGTGGLGNDSDDNAENHGYASPAVADHQYIADADTKGRHLGTRIKYTAITDVIWVVEGFAITSGAIVTPWT
jgi:hypothetical protein